MRRQDGITSLHSFGVYLSGRTLSLVIVREPKTINVRSIIIIYVESIVMRIEYWSSFR